MRADAARNRRRVLEAAHQAFARSGVSASLDDIARAAGVGPGTLYRHFPTRDLLVLGVIADGLHDLADRAAGLLDHPDPAEALQIWLQAYVEQAGLFDGLARSLVAPPDGGEGKQACDAASAAGAALLQRAVAAGALRPDAGAGDVLDMAAAIAWVSEQPDRDVDQRNRLVRILVDGLRAPSHSHAG
jgi:AcrR family transcriptional regulator